MYRNILAPVDDQEQSYAAMRVVGMMAACDKARVTLLHVRKPPEEVVTDIVTEEKLFAQPLKERESRMFARCKDALMAFGVEPEARVVESDNIVAAIIEECRSGGYDVIIMGHRGRKALKQLLLGSVATGVLTESPCPVILVHVPKE